MLWPFILIFGHNHVIRMTTVKHGYQIENQKTYFPNRESGFIIMNQDINRDSSSKQVHTLASIET